MWSVSSGRPGPKSAARAYGWSGTIEGNPRRMGLGTFLARADGRRNCVFPAFSVDRPARAGVRTAKGVGSPGWRWRSQKGGVMQRQSMPHAAAGGVARAALLVLLVGVTIPSPALAVGELDTTGC